MQTADGYILAAKSLSSQIILGEVDKLHKHAKQAHDYAKMAMAQGTPSYEARLQYALSYGLVTRTSSNIKAWRKQLPMKTHNAIMQLRRDYPQSAEAIALDAAWHLGIIRKTGEKAGQKWFNASAQTGHALYQQAMMIAPEDIVIRTNYVMAVLALDMPPDYEFLAQNLQIIMTLTPHSDLEQKVQARAIALYQSFEDREFCKIHAENFLDGKWDK